MTDRDSSMLNARSALRTLLGTVRGVRCHQPPTVTRWTGVEVRGLRVALRYGVRGFADYLGVSDRMVSKWEARGSMITPRPVNQAALDVTLARADPAALYRFAALLHAAAVDAVTARQRWADLTGAPRYEVHLPLTGSTLQEALDVAAELAAALTGHPDHDPTMLTVSRTDQPTMRHAVPAPWVPA